MYGRMDTETNNQLTTNRVCCRKREEKRREEKNQFLSIDPPPLVVVSLERERANESPYHTMPRHESETKNLSNTQTPKEQGIIAILCYEVHELNPN